MSTYGYEEARATATMRDVPRFGHVASFAYLFGTQEQRQDYFYGLMFGGVLVLAFFFVWFLLLLILRCCCKRRRVGFLQGGAMYVSHDSKRPRRVRITFILSAIIVICFSVTLVTQGLTQLQTSVDTVYDSVLELEKILEGAENFIAELRSIAAEAGPLRNVLNARLQDDFCPNGNLSAMDIDFDGIIQNSSSSIDDLGDFTQQDVNELQEAFAEINSTNHDAETYSDSAIQVSDWQSLIFLVPFPVFCTIFIVATIVAWRGGGTNKCYKCFLSWFLFPLFFLLVLFCCVLSGAMLLAASANADFCSGGDDKTPEGTIVDIMEINGYNDTQLVFDILTFYLSQCDRGDPYGFLTKYEDELATGASQLQTFVDAIRNTTIDRLMEQCGEQDFQSIFVIITALQQRLDRLFTAVKDFLSLLSCKSLVPIYTNAFWDGTCQYSVKGFTWTFSSFLIIGIFGMTMVTLRSACRPTKFIDNDGDNFNKFESVPLDTVEDESTVQYEPYQPPPSGSASAHEDDSFRDDFSSSSSSRDEDESTTTY